MNVTAYDSLIQEDEAHRLNIKLEDLDTLLRKAVFVSIHVPLLPEIFHMIGRRELKLMRSTACLINVARGPIVHEKILFEVHEKGWIGGAVLDVYSNARAFLLP